jgi:hypothetical protein
MVRIHVIEQHRRRPNPWEVAWVVVGNDERFVAFVPKPEGWHVEMFDGRLPEGEQQTFLVSGERPAFPVEEPLAVAMVVWEGGVLIVGATFPSRPSERLFVDWRWSSDNPAPDWWQDPHRAGVYLEDCSARVEWGR